MNDVGSQIRAMAQAGHSKTQTRQLLGYSRDSFEAVLELIGPVEFPGPNRSCGYRAATARKRGLYTEAMRKASALAGQAKHEKAKRTLRGVTGTIEELVEAFGAQVCAQHVRRRMRQGMTLEAALLTPKSTRNNLGALLGVTPDRRREMAATHGGSKKNRKGGRR
jgi:hypothetical protein